MNGNMIKISLAALAIGASSVWAGEKEIEIEQLPAPVLAAAKTACPDGVIKEAAKEKEDGVVAYEVEMMVGNMGCDLKIAPDGTLLEKEQQVAVKDLPQKVAGTLKSFAEATVQKAERVQEKDEAAFYEINVVMNGQAMELKINEAGQIIEVETKGKKHDDEEDDEHEEHEENDDD